MKDDLNLMAEEYATNMQNYKPTITKPSMPKPDPTAYTDYEYLSCLEELLESLQDLDSLDLTEKFLKGE